MKIPSKILLLSLSTLFWEASGHRPINFQPPGCNRRCPFNYDPVCGTDGKTYANMCTLVVARRCDNVNVRRRHPGECGSTNTNCNPNAGCPFNYAPVCGSDGQTYANDCVFRNAVCRNPGLRKVSDGECGSNNQNCRPSAGCPFNYAPVCGSDGQTYANDCVFRNAVCRNPGLRKVSDGECGSNNQNCRPTAGCPFNYEPVCGSNGQTYGNLCVFQNAACNIPNLSKVSDGECGSNNQNCRPSAGCPFNYEPVCGSNGQTYGNLCVFQNAACNIPNLSKVSDGECGSTNQNCRPSVGCPFNYAPVCGSDGQTYSNLCTFQNAACNVPNLVKVSDGECGSTNSNCRQRVGCPFNLAPVCGSNGQTYPNECVFQNAVCSDPTLTKVSDGECGNGNGNGNGNPNCRPSPICPLNYSPICGSDGKTYGNECDFRNAACNNPRLEQLFSGECGVPNPLCKQTLLCPSTYDPVCGSNGQTYENECVFSNAACSIPDLRMVSDNQCSSQRPNCPQICPANYVPVCGSDGRTYGNACNLGVASCNNPSIRKVSDGECGFMGRIMSFIQNNL